MANAPLNPSAANANLLALALEKIGPISYVDTGEPVVTTLTATATLLATFPLNGAGNQPTVAQGAYAIQFGSFTGTDFQVGAITIEACDSTATNAGHIEVVDVIAQFPANVGGLICRNWYSSLAAPNEAGNNGLTNVVTLRAVVTGAGTISGVVKFVAVGTP